MSFDGLPVCECLGLVPCGDARRRRGTKGKNLAPPVFAMASERCLDASSAEDRADSEAGTPPSGEGLTFLERPSLLGNTGVRALSASARICGSGRSSFPRNTKCDRRSRFRNRPSSTSFLASRTAKSVIPHLLEYCWNSSASLINSRRLQESMPFRSWIVDKRPTRVVVVFAASSPAWILALRCAALFSCASLLLKILPRLLPCGCRRPDAIKASICSIRFGNHCPISGTSSQRRASRSETFRKLTGSPFRAFFNMTAMSPRRDPAGDLVPSHRPLEGAIELIRSIHLSRTFVREVFEKRGFANRCETSARGNT